MTSDDTKWGRKTSISTNTHNLQLLQKSQLQLVKVIIPSPLTSFITPNTNKGNFTKKRNKANRNSKLQQKKNTVYFEATKKVDKFMCRNFDESNFETKQLHWNGTTLSCEVENIVKRSFIYNLQISTWFHTTAYFIFNFYFTTTIMLHFSSWIKVKFSI